MNLIKDGNTYVINVGDSVELKTGYLARVIRIARPLDDVQRFEVRHADGKFEMINENEIMLFPPEQEKVKLDPDVEEFPFEAFDKETEDSKSEEVSVKGAQTNDSNPDITKSKTGALKEFSKGGVPKTRFSLLPQAALKEVADVLTLGADKYAAYNFSKGAKDTTYIDAAMRHLHAYLMNEDIDPESKKHHLAHAAADILMTLDNIMVGTVIDDRNKIYKLKRDDESKTD